MRGSAVGLRLAARDKALRHMGFAPGSPAGDRTGDTLQL